MLYARLLEENELLEEKNECQKPSLKEEKEDHFIARDIESLYSLKVLLIVIKADRDGFSDVGAWTSTIKLARAST